jgi:hypothetical protein
VLTIGRLAHAAATSSESILDDDSALQFCELAMRTHGCAPTFRLTRPPACISHCKVFTVLALVIEWNGSSYLEREFRSQVMTSDLCFAYMPVTLVAFDPPA